MENHSFRNKDFQDPTFKQLAAINGKINVMSRHDVVVQLSQFHLDTQGTSEVLKKRLKNYYRQKKLKKAGLLDRLHCTPLDCLVVIDFEATCDTPNNGYNHEIIEFPAVLVNVHNEEIVDKFHSFCRPVINPILTDFCIQLTGIQQAQVSIAKTFPDVLTQFEDWMSRHFLGKGFTYAVVTDGPWDMAKFLKQQCELSQIPFPKFGKKWISISKTYSNFYRTKRLPLAGMLKHAGLEFEGKPHCGLDDTYNIARIVLRMLKDGALLKVNEFLHNNSLTNKNEGPRYTQPRTNRFHPKSEVESKETDELEELVVFNVRCRIRNNPNPALRF